MAPNPKKPVILIIHGAYMFANIWDPFREFLAQAGFESVCPQQPSTNDDSPADKKKVTADDAKVIQDAAKDLIAKGRQIIALPHSYGGAVACSALTDDLFASSPDAPGILHIIWLAAWVPQQGKTVADIIGQHGMQSAVDLAFNEDGTAYPKNAEVSFFGDVNDVDPERALDLAKKTAKHNWAATTSVVTGAPYKHPSTYVVCTNDKAIFPPLQRAMLGDAIEAGGNIETVELPTDHCPFVSRQQDLLDIIGKATSKYVKQA